MSELPNAQRMLEAAERAATAGDLESADKLLRDAAFIQEAELGPLHADLANTLNNLAIVAERTGQQADAEKFYRRAAAIAAATFPPDHPMVTASRENLEDFCHASGLPLDAPAFMTLSDKDADLGLDVFATEDAGGKAKRRPRVRTSDTPSAGPTTPLSETLLSMTSPPEPRRAPRAIAWAAIAMVLVASAALVVARTWSSREAPTPAPTAGATTPPAAVTPPTAGATTPPAAVTPPPATATAPPATEPAAAAPSSTPPPQPSPAPPRVEATAPSASGVSLATAELCRTLSTSGGSWRCNPAGDSIAPGRVVFYTRVRSPHDATVIHHWYRGDTLRKSVPLTIRASANEGYRTYSQHTVDGGDDWRVEITTEDGVVLHEERFTVRVP